MTFKLLNLDEISDNVDRSIVLNGVSHKMKDICVEEMIEAQIKITELESGKSDPMDQLKSVIGMLVNRFPTTTPADFGKMSLTKLMTLYKWLHQTPEQIGVGEENPSA